MLIRECFRAGHLRRASKLLRPSPRQLPRGSSYLEAPGRREQPSRGSGGSGSSHLEAPELLEQPSREAPEVLGAAILRLQRLWEQPSRGSRGSGSSHLEALEALGAGSRGSGSSEIEAPEAFEAPVAPTSFFLKFSRVFSSLETFRGALPTAPGGSGRLSGGSERVQEASRCL